MLDFSKEDDDVSELSEFSSIHEEDIVYRYLLVKLLVRAGFRQRH